MALATSQIEKHFQMHSIYKRSKDVLDVEQLKSSEHRNAVYNRKPTHSIDTLDTRVDSSFMNGIQLTNIRLNRDIINFKKRYQNEDEELNELMDLYDVDEETRQIIKESHRSKGLDWSKMEGRKTNWVTKPLYNSEDRFNNFRSSLGRSQQSTVNMRKNSRKSAFSINPERGLEIDSNSVGKSQQKNKFDESIFRCLIEYDKKDKQWQNLSRSLPPIAKSEIDSASIELGKEKTMKSTISHIHQFYHSTSKDDPPQMAIRLSHSNVSHYQPLSARDSGDTGDILRKQQMLEKRRAKFLLEKLGSPDNRAHMCEEKYFKRRELRKNKQRQIY